MATTLTGRRLATALLVASLAATCAACAGTATTTPTDPPAATPAGTAIPVRPSASQPDAVNPVDVMFVQMTLDQHSAAAELTRLAAARATDPQVRMLTAAIAATQADEAHIMSGWLTGRGQPTSPAPDAPQDHGAQHSHDALRGTTDADIALLADAPADEFDRILLNILVAHQHNAVELAAMVLDAGTDPQVRALAEQITRSRTAQIRQMLTILG